MYGAAGEHGNEEQNRISVYCGHCYQVSRSHGITGFFCPKKTQSRRLHSFSHWANVSEHLPSARPVVSSPSGDRTLQSEGPGIAEDFEGPAPAPAPCCSHHVVLGPLQGAVALVPTPAVCKVSQSSPSREAGVS